VNFADVERDFAVEPTVPAFREEPCSTAASGYGRSILTIDISAIVHNYKLIRSYARSARCAAVVKADAYGLGARIVAPALSPGRLQRFLRRALGRRHMGDDQRPLLFVHCRIRVGMQGIGDVTSFNRIGPHSPHFSLVASTWRRDRYIKT
jgi:Alanine racemase, N-terminal domain